MRIQPNPVPMTPRPSPIKDKSGVFKKRVETIVKEESRLRNMFGERFFGSEEWQRFLNVPFSREQLANAPRFPWDNAYLNQPCPFTQGERIRNTHMAFLGIPRVDGTPLTIPRLFELRGCVRQPKLYLPKHPRLHQEHFFRGETLQHRWYLSPLRAVPIFLQLPYGYYSSSALEETQKLFLHYARTGRYPYQGATFTSNTNSAGQRVFVGVMGGQIFIHYDSYYSQTLSTEAALSNVPRR